MKKMKRLVAVLLAGIMALAMLTACGGTPGTPGSSEFETKVEQAYMAKLNETFGVNFDNDDETGDWYICRADDSEGFIVWKDKRCARFSAGFIVQRLMRQAKVERKSVQFMMARMPVEIGGVAYYKILLANPILR